MRNGATLRLLRKKMKLTQEELSAIVGVSRGAIYDWERDAYSPEGDNLINLAKALDVSVAYLIGETDDPSPADRTAVSVCDVNSDRKKKNDIKEPVHATQLDDVIFVPIVSNKVVTACCGNGSAYADDVAWEYEGQFPVPANLLIGYTWQGCSYKIMEAEGSSMEPYIYDRDKILFVEDSNVGVGDIVVVSIDNRLFIKGIIKINEKELCLRSYNWQISPDKTVNLEGDTEVCVIGKVLKVVSSRDIPKMI